MEALKEVQFSVEWQFKHWLREVKVSVEMELLKVVEDPVERVEMWAEV